MSKIMLLAIALIVSMSVSYGHEYNLGIFMDKILEWYIHAHPDLENPVVVQCHEDQNHYYMDIHEDSYGSEYFKDAVSQSYSGHVVVFWGETMPPFWTGNNDEFELNSPELYRSFEPDEENKYINWDPDIWSMAFHKDGTLCKMFTYMTTPLDSLDENVIDMADRYLGGYTVTDYDRSHIYMFVDRMAEFPEGNAELYNAMTSLLDYHSDCDGMALIPVSIKLVINVDGKSDVIGFIRQSGDPAIDDAAMWVARIITETFTFKPASHRNEAVRTYFSLQFTKSMFSGVSPYAD